MEKSLWWQVFETGVILSLECNSEGDERGDNADNELACVKRGESEND